MMEEANRQGMAKYVSEGAKTWHCVVELVYFQRSPRGRFSKRSDGFQKFQFRFLSQSCFGALKLRS